MAADIRAIRKPEPYKGKGVRYDGRASSAARPARPRQQAEYEGIVMSTHRQEARRPASRRHARVRKKVQGTAERPRLAVFRSNRHISAQVIDDRAGRTLAAASTSRPTCAAARPATATPPPRSAQLVAERAKAAGVTTVVFDRGGYLYHGRVAAVADAAREAGLEF